MSLFDDSYVDLIATISQDYTMMPIKMFGPLYATRRSLEALDTLIDESIELHADKKFNSILMTRSMEIAKGVSA